MKTILTALSFLTLVPVLASAFEVTVFNTFQDDRRTEGREAIFDKGGPSEVGEGFEFVAFPLNFGSDNTGSYAIDVGDNYISFLLLDNSGATSLVLPSGTFDRYYFTFDKPIEKVIMLDELTDLKSSVQVLPPGYKLDFEDVFNFNIAVPAKLKNGGILVEILPGADLRNLGQSISLGFMYDSGEVVAVWNTFQDDVLTHGLEAMYDGIRPIPINSGVTFHEFPKHFGSDQYGYYDINVGNYLIIFTLTNNTGATYLVFPHGTYDRYYFEFSDEVASAEIMGDLTDISASVDVLPPGYPFEFLDLFHLSTIAPNTLVNGGVLVEVLPGADISEIGQRIVISYRLGVPGIPDERKQVMKRNEKEGNQNLRNFEHPHKRKRGHHSNRENGNEDNREG